MMGRGSIMGDRGMKLLATGYDAGFPATSLGVRRVAHLPWPIAS